MADASAVKKLRDLTGAGVMDVKSALEEAGNDFDKAAEIIKEKGLAKADKKAEREIKAGIIKTYTHNDRVGVVLKLGCETDFVARSEPFRELAHNLAVHIVAMNPANVEELMAQPFVKDEKTSVENLVKGVIAKTGENIRIDEFYRLEL
ncbi:MAG: Elongation factor Ts [Parcubacteria group bacterium GW2011_GWA1_47_11]|uniref:Elongation factor Ts n=1 Tax=Candidatus Colwellbacteria bacterium GWA2_46_10 TaxID=1797684 RepID=A0A1G1YVZ0_9BACT|nr:MAG: Elongation factor Ts [Parcubacteria group bacterium GW2011_GWA2_46_10]KKU56165.1 MAG: Elongation factor Ts [Parcubacteria group bacterium GW2011_GWA1_47_11]OGY56553.1 MAG: translation elongation factor Ts [Candidatus Colwellbacteria bacterium GWA2_46_10]